MNDIGICNIVSVLYLYLYLSVMMVGCRAGILSKPKPLATHCLHKPLHEQHVHGFGLMVMSRAFSAVRYFFASALISLMLMEA